MSLPSSLRNVPKEDLTFSEDCPICGESRSHGEIVTVLQSIPIEVNMRSCPNCHACSAEALPSAEHLQKVYDPTHYSATLTNLSWLTKSLAKKIVARFDLADRTSINVLDYGGGNGKLAKELIKQLHIAYPHIQNIKARVVDLYLEESEPNLDFQYVDDFLKSTDEYDIVVASAVLEHIPNLQAILTRLLDSGTNNALMYARCPYEVPLATIGNFYSINWPIHIHDIGPKFWQTLVNKKQGKVQIIKSQTSLVETSMKDAFLRTVIAHFFKVPSHIETYFLKKIYPYKGHIWPYVGGWEVYLRLNTSQ